MRQCAQLLWGVAVLLSVLTATHSQQQDLIYNKNNNNKNHNNKVKVDCRCLRGRKKIAEISSILQNTNTIINTKHEMAHDNPVSAAQGTQDADYTTLRRRKRDLRGVTQPARRLQRKFQPMKKWTNKPNKEPAAAPFGAYLTELFKRRRPTRPLPLRFGRGKLMKRHIKTEYDLREEERQHTDGTLPEIVQFIPEVGQYSPNKLRATHKCDRRGYTEHASLSREEQPKASNKYNAYLVTPTTIVHKRAADAAMLPSQFGDSLNIFYRTPNFWSNINAEQQQQQGQLRRGGPQQEVFSSSSPPLVVDLDFPKPTEMPNIGTCVSPSVIMSAATLDRLIAHIVYQNPRFIEATTHMGGALVDPELLQEMQTRELLWQLIKGRRT